MQGVPMNGGALRGRGGGMAFPGQYMNGGGGYGQAGGFGGTFPMHGAGTMGGFVPRGRGRGMTTKLQRQNQQKQAVEKKSTEETSYFWQARERAHSSGKKRDSNPADAKELAVPCSLSDPGKFPSMFPHLTPVGTNKANMQWASAQEWACSP
jgi:hypothetical protein